MVSRPSRTQVQVKIGAYANGEPRLAIYNWSSCKIAHLREGFTEGARPQLGRRPARPSDSTPQNKLTENRSALGGFKQRSPEVDPLDAANTSAAEDFERGNFQTSLTPNSTLPRPEPNRSRPVRTTRNKNPHYVE